MKGVNNLSNFKMTKTQIICIKRIYLLIKDQMKSKMEKLERLNCMKLEEEMNFIKKKLII